jgi:anti-sigma regulatory factor (Ser/Thr protein kinase)
MRSSAAGVSASPSNGGGATIEALTAEVARLRVENAELVATMRKREGAGEGALDSIEVTVPMGPGAPAVARDSVTRWLSGIVPDRVRDDARLLVSELVTNALHAGLPSDTPLWISGRLTHGVLWLQVGNPGRAGAIAQRDPAPRTDGGSGLQLVEMVAARWGVNRSADTRVWFELLAA